MKKILFIIIAVLTCFLASTYRYRPLLIIFVMEIVMGLVLFLLPHYFKRKLLVQAVQQSAWTQRGQACDINLRVQNSGVLPVGRFRVRLRYGYEQGKRWKKKQIYGGCARGKEEIRFEMCPYHCGMVQLRFDRLRVYDYLMLFAASKRLSEEMQIAVFPHAGALHVTFSDTGCLENHPLQDTVRGGRGDIADEIRQIREYQAGDLNRHIHWNQSARMDQLWVREYERESDVRFELLLELTGFLKITPEEKDAFYEILMALVLGLLREAAIVQVHWYDGHTGDLTHMEVADEQQIRELLTGLYRLEWPDREEDETELEQHFWNQTGCFRLDVGLNWYWKETLIYQFSDTAFEEEIAGKIFVV